MTIANVLLDVQRNCLHDAPKRTNRARFSMTCAHCVQQTRCDRLKIHSVYKGGPECGVKLGKQCPWCAWTEETLNADACIKSMGNEIPEKRKLSAPTMIATQAKKVLRSDDVEFEATLFTADVTD